MCRPVLCLIVACLSVNACAYRGQTGQTGPPTTSVMGLPQMPVCLVFCFAEIAVEYQTDTATETVTAGSGAVLTLGDVQAQGGAQTETQDEDPALTFGGGGTDRLPGLGPP